MDKFGILKKIAELRTKVGVTKDGENKFGNYKYYQIDDIYNASKMLMNELGIVTVYRQEVLKGEHLSHYKERSDGSVINKMIVPSIDENTKEIIGTKEQYKETIGSDDIEETQTCTDVYTCYLDVYDTEDGSKVTFSVTTRSEKLKGMVEYQSAGSMITYTTKYLYGLMLMMDDGKTDPDMINTHGKESKKLTRTQLIAKTDTLSESKKKAYLDAYNKKSGKDLDSFKFVTTQMLELIATKEGWN
jgi:hypothetical protein